MIRPLPWACQIHTRVPSEPASVAYMSADAIEFVSRRAEEFVTDLESHFKGFMGIVLDQLVDFLLGNML